MSAIVTCRGIVKHYRQGTIDVPALRGIDLEIAKGDFASLAGPSGSGKTTFLNILGGLDRPSDGTVTIDGEEITKLGNNALADLRLRKIGFVFQAFHVLPHLTVERNVALPLLLRGAPEAEIERRARVLVAAVGLAGREARLPRELSGGELQRVAIARALVGDPKLWPLYTSDAADE